MGETSTRSQRKRTLEALERRFAQAKAEHQTQEEKNKKRKFEHKEGATANIVSLSADSSVQRYSDASSRKGSHDIHNKKRRSLAQGRLNDLVFVKCNRALRHRFNITDTTDPIFLSEIDESNEWLLGRMEEDESDNDDLVFEDDSLTWGTVSRASGAMEPLYRTRAITNTREKGSSSNATRLHLMDEDDEDEDINLIGSDEGEEEKLLSEEDDINDY